MHVYVEVIKGYLLEVPDKAFACAESDDDRIEAAESWALDQTIGYIEAEGDLQTAETDHATADA